MAEFRFLECQMPPRYSKEELLMAASEIPPMWRQTPARTEGAYKIESLPEGLKIIQRGGRAEHFEIVPAYEMPLETFQNLLNQIVVSGPY